MCLILYYISKKILPKKIIKENGTCALYINQAQLIKEIKKKNIMSGTIITVKNKLKKMCGTTIN
jgi:hypothetical protein